MLRAMQIAISDTTRKTGIFMEKPQRRTKKTCAVNWPASCCQSEWAAQVSVTVVLDVYLQSLKASFKIKMFIN